LVLYFHHVHPDIDHYTSLTPEAFARGVDEVLTDFEPLDPAAVLDWPQLTVTNRPRVLLTFDDGYRDLLTYALPVLEARGLRAVFFVCTRLLGPRDADPRADYLDWTQCAALHGAGHVIASHGLTHTPLDRLSDEERAAEVRESIYELRDLLGLPKAVYAYPYGIQAPVPEQIAGVGPLLAFGSVKAPARPWTAAPLAIRRTYLPTGGEDSWPGLVRSWRRQWEE
jgi:peptidoglycan/xylan/chitin deacetylase (PgdA/CDA1 family)